MSIKIETITKAICPHCNEPDSTIDHLLGSNQETKWYCDACGGRYSLTFSESGCDVSPLREWRINLAVVLMHNNIFVVVEGAAYAKDDPSNYDASNLRYFYDEHTCPVNWMGVECLYDAENNDTDPHGLFRFLGFELFPDDGGDCNFNWEPLIARVRNEYFFGFDRVE